MWILLFINTCLAEADEAFISLGDEIIVGPDERLEQVLEQWRDLADEALASMRELDDIMNAQFRAKQSQRRVPSAHLNDSARRALEAYHKVLGLPVEVDTDGSTAPVLKVIKLIKTLIQKVQNRLKDLQPLLKKYNQDKLVRHGNTVCVLELWKKDMMAKITRIATEGLDLSVPYHVDTYQHLLTINVDIHQVIDFLLYDVSVEKHYMSAEA